MEEAKARAPKEGPGHDLGGGYHARVTPKGDVDVWNAKVGFPGGRAYAAGLQKGAGQLRREYGITPDTKKIHKELLRRSGEWNKTYKKLPEDVSVEEAMDHVTVKHHPDGGGKFHFNCDHKTHRVKVTGEEGGVDYGTVKHGGVITGGKITKVEVLPDK